MSALADDLGNYLGRAAAVVLRWRKLTIAATLAAAALALWYAAHNLGVNTDTANMISATLPWRQNFNEYRDAFPARDRNLLIVIDAPSPARADQFAAKLLAELRRDPESLSLDSAAGRGRVLRAQRSPLSSARRARAAVRPARRRAAAARSAQGALRRRRRAGRRDAHARSAARWRRDGRGRARAVLCRRRAHARRRARGRARAVGVECAARERPRTELAPPRRAAAGTRLHANATRYRSDCRDSRDRRAPERRRACAGDRAAQRQRRDGARGALERHSRRHVRRHRDTVHGRARAVRGAALVAPARDLRAHSVRRACRSPRRSRPPRSVI